MIGILLHNWAESLSIGTGLARRHRDDPAKGRLVLLVSLYSLVQPIGIGIGWAILKFSEPLISIVASALAGGTFMYAGATEVVGEEFNGKRKYSKCFYYLLGVGVILVGSLIARYTTNE